MRPGDDLAWTGEIRTDVAGWLLNPWPLVEAAVPGAVVTYAGGQCPVQAAVRLPDGSRVYFRARGDARIDFWGPGHPPRGGDQDYFGDVPLGDPDESIDLTEEVLPDGASEYPGWWPPSFCAGLVVRECRRRLNLPEEEP